MFLLIATPCIANNGYFGLCNKTKGKLKVTWFRGNDKKGVPCTVNSGQCVKTNWKTRGGRLYYLYIDKSSYKPLDYHSNESLAIKVKTENQGAFSKGRITGVSTHNSLFLMKYKVKISTPLYTPAVEFMHLTVFDSPKLSLHGGFTNSCKDIKVENNNLIAFCTYWKGPYVYEPHTYLNNISILQEAIHAGLTPKDFSLDMGNDKYLFTRTVPQIVPIGRYLNTCPMVFYNAVNRTLYAACKSSSGFKKPTYIMSKLVIKKSCRYIVSNEGTLACQNNL